MTSAVVAPVARTPAGANGGASKGPATTTKKRRRRTAAGGATDDCFTCRSRAVKCGRERPYCRQCMEIGNSCSGYKTTLTWGVGVASRGKLRGLTCPVADKNVDGSDVKPEEVQARKRRKSSVSTIKLEDISESTPKSFTSDVPTSPTATTRDAASSHFVATSQAQNVWPMQSFLGQIETKPDRRRSSIRQPYLQPLQTALGQQHDALGVPQSGRSISSYAETEFYSPMEYPRTPGSSMLQFGEQLPRPPVPHAFSEPMSGASVDSYTMPGTAINPFSDLSSQIDPELQAGEFQDPTSTQLQTQTDIGNFDEEILRQADSMDLFSGLGLMPDAGVPLNTLGTPFSPFDEETYNREDGENSLLMDTRFNSPFFHLAPRFQTLMTYYDTNICPYLVTYDGPQNPYRRHILQLAVDNPGLQNALAALSLNNHRMRRAAGQRAQLGLVHDLGTADPTPEEQRYKQLSIDQLNTQLTDVRSAQDDGVLATLLILCLFHVCDSGFSKFRTQLAGVQKLLSLRRPNTRPSDFTGWVEMFFTWFDVMTSTVNDREMQINRDSLAMLDYSTNLGALEQFSGCDGRLFKLIARLGRLNLLAQGRPVKAPADGETPTPAVLAAESRKQRRFPAKPRTPRSLSPLDYENIDGNGWGTPILDSDEEDAPGTPDSREQTPIPRDSRQTFWSEWHAVRTHLLAWRPSTHHLAPSPDTPQNGHALDASQRDLLHINESFRSSALLYTERLGSPLLPSSHTTFQQLVHQALYHITALPTSSCVNKFLLWPLFIVGTECVDPGHRNVIRSRCGDLTDESGFFNNLSSLEVLERVWREGNVGGEAEEMRARRRDSTTVGVAGGVGQAFRWRKAMDRVDGEYIVI